MRPWNLNVLRKLGQGQPWTAFLWTKESHVGCYLPCSETYHIAKKLPGPEDFPLFPPVTWRSPTTAIWNLPPHKCPLKITKRYHNLFRKFDKFLSWQDSLHKPISPLQALWPIEISRFYEAWGWDSPALLDSKACSSALASEAVERFSLILFRLCSAKTYGVIWFQLS